MIDLYDALALAGVPETLREEAMQSLEDAEARAGGLLWFKLRTRWFRASKIAGLLAWEDERLADRCPDMADMDIEPLMNVTAQGDGAPWFGGPGTGRPVLGHWLDRDPASADYQAGVAANYWLPGTHPRSADARKAWYRRNGGAFRAYRLGAPIDPDRGIQVWEGGSGRLSVQVCRAGSAWLINAQRRIVGNYGLRYRAGFEVDNVLNVQPPPKPRQLWFPAPGYGLRAPVTWSTVAGKLKSPEGTDRA